MLLAVAMRKIAWRWSCIHDKSVPNIRCERPPSADSVPAEANAFSISSIHSTAGAIDSAWARASRSRDSLSPMYF